MANLGSAHTDGCINASALSYFFCLVAVPLLLITPRAIAQGPASSAAATAKRDPAALAIIRDSLAAMGGAQLWSAQSFVVMDGDLTPADPKRLPQTVHWEDQWREGYSFRRESANSAGKHIRLGDSIQGGRVVSPSANRTLSAEADQNAVPVQLPGAMFSLVLSHSAYQVTVAEDGDPDKKSPYIHLLVLKLTSHTALPDIRQDWYLDKLSLVPDHVAFRVPDLRSSTQLIMEEIAFASYQTVAGLSVPSTLSVMGPHNLLLHTVHFSTISFPASLPAERFTGVN